MIIDRRHFLNMISIGTGLVGGAALVSAPAISGETSKLTPAPLPETVRKLPPRERLEGRITYQGEDNIVIENLHIIGTLRVFDCTNVTIRNVEVEGGESFGGLVCRDSPGTKIYDAFLHDNPGHGLFLRGNIDGIEGHRVQSWKNQHDGVQVSEGAVGTATLFDPLVKDNIDNAIDIKAGSLEIHGGRLEGAGDELLLMMAGANSLLLNGTILIEGSKKAFLRLAAGSAELKNVGFSKKSHFKWFWVNRTVYHKAQNLEVSNLKVTDGFEVIDAGTVQEKIGPSKADAR